MLSDFDRRRVHDAIGKAATAAVSDSGGVEEAIRQLIVAMTILVNAQEHAP